MIAKIYWPGDEEKEIERYFNKLYELEEFLDRVCHRTEWFDAQVYVPATGHAYHIGSGEWWSNDENDDYLDDDCEYF